MSFIFHTSPLQQTTNLHFPLDSVSLSLCRARAANGDCSTHGLTSQVSHCLLQPRSGPSLLDSPSLLPQAVLPSLCSTFNGQRLSLSSSQCSPINRSYRASKLVMTMVKPMIQFIQGTDELTVPDVSLTKSRDGTNGVAKFRFDQPSVFDASGEIGDIIGFYMIDEEGVIQSSNVSAKLVNGKPVGIEAQYVMRSPREWDRFMRFMERYSNANGLQFIKK